MVPGVLHAFFKLTKGLFRTLPCPPALISIQPSCERCEQVFRAYLTRQEPVPARLEKSKP